MHQGTGSRLFRPRRNLFTAAWLVWLAFTTPVFFAIYLLTAPDERWLPFAIAHVGLIAAFALASWRLRGAGILLGADGIREREYFSRMVFTPVEQIAEVIVVRVRDSYSDEISRQVFVTDAAGGTLLRLRSPLWHPADFADMIDYFDVPVRVMDEEMTWRVLRREYGRNLEPWERHPVRTTVVCAVLLGAATLGAVMAIMAAVG